MPRFISFKSNGVLLSPVAKAPGGISGTITPTVGVTMPEMFNFWKISCPNRGMMLDVFGLRNRCHGLPIRMIYEWWDMYPHVDYHWSTLVRIQERILVTLIASLQTNPGVTDWCDRVTSKAHENHDYTAFSTFRTLQQVSHQLTDALLQNWYA